MQNLHTHLTTYGKTHSWLELAKMFNVLPNATNKQRSDKVRRYYNRTVLKTKTKYEPVKHIINIPKEAFINQEVISQPQSDLFNEFKIFLQSKRASIKNIEPYKGGNPNNILVIGDLHIPFNHSEYLNFCIHLQRKWDCGKVIFIGDILDFHASSYHTSEMNLPSADFELELSKVEISKWYQAFPEATVLIGNHDRMVTRKLFDANISQYWQKSFNEVLNVPNWTFLNEYVYNNIYFNHGEGAEANRTCLYKQISTVQGHRHGSCYVQYPAQGIFAVQCPIGVNRESHAFNYAKLDVKPWQIGATVIIDSKTPIIELM